MKHAEDKNGGDGVQQSQVSSSEPGPNILANNVIGPLLLEALDGFLFMVSCTGEVEFVSENVTNYLRYLQNDLISKSIYSIIHPDDQLDFSNRLTPLIERSRAPSSDRPVGRSISFTCRLQVKPNETPPDSGSVVRPQVPQYEALQILALLQQYPNDRDSRESGGSTSQELGNHYFLACIARRLNVMERTPAVHDVAQFLTKQDLKGKILDCDTSRFSTDQLSLSAFIGHNIKDLCHPNDTSQLDRHHNEVLRIGTNLSGVYRMQLAPGHYVFVQTKSKLFKNSANGQSEFIMSTHSIVRKCDKDSELNGSASNSLMKALIGKSLPLSKPRERENASKSHDQKSQHLTGMFDGSSGGYLPSQCYSSRGGGGGGGVVRDTVNSDMDIDRLSSAGDISDVSDINDLLEILHRQDASSFSSNGGPLNFDILSNNPFDDVTPLMQEVLRQSPISADRRSAVNGFMPRPSALMSSNSDHGVGGGGQKFSDVQNGNGNQMTPFNDSLLSDDDVTMLLLNILPAQMHQQQHQQQQQQQQQVYQSMNQRQGSSSHQLTLTNQPSNIQHSSSSLNMNATTAGHTRSTPLRRRSQLAVSSAQGTAVGINSPLSSSYCQGVTSPGLMSPLTGSSPVLPPNMMSPSPASVSSPWPQSSPVFSDDAKPVTLIEQMRRKRCSSNLSQLNTSVAQRSSDSAFTCSTPGGTPQSALKNVGLKDLLLSADDDDVSAKSEGHLSKSDSRFSDTPSSGLLSNNRSSFLFPSSDGPLENRRRHPSACDRPDSSTKSGKPNVLLMKLLSGQDEADNDGESCPVLTPSSATNDVHSGGMFSKPTSSVNGGDHPDENRRDSATESSLARSNNLLRQLLNDEKDEGQSPQSPRPLKLLEKLMNSEVSPSTTEKPSSMTQHSPTGLIRLMKSPGSDKASTKDKYRPTPEDNDKLKKLTSRWDSSDSTTTAVPKIGIKRKASVVMETPADSTEDSVASSTSSGGERVVGSSRKQPRKDILLTRLLSTTHTGSEPMLDTQAINAIATGTPQMNLVRRSVAEFFTVPGDGMSSVGTHSENKASNAMSRMVSSGSSGGSLLNNSDSRPGLTSSLLNADSNLQYLSVGDMEMDDDLTNMLHNITPMEADAAASGEDSALLSQLEHILSSPSIALAELDSLLGDGSIDPTSSSSSTRIMSVMASDSCDQMRMANVVPSHQEPPSTTSDQPTAKPNKKSGTGLLQQLLGGQDDGTARMNQPISFSQRYSSGYTESMSSSTVCNDVSSSRLCSTMVTSSSSSSLSSSSGGLSTPADVAALIQKAAAQAASRTSSINNGSQSSMADGRSFHSHHNNMRNYVQGEHNVSSLSAMNNLNDLLNVTIPPNVTAPVVARNQRLSVSASTPFSSSVALNVRGQGQGMSSVRTTTCGNKQREDFSRQAMNTAIMAGGAIVQNSGIETMSGQSHGNSLSIPMSNSLFSTDLNSPQSAISNRDLPSPFSSLSHLTTKSSRNALSSSPATSFSNGPHASCNTYLSQPVAPFNEMKQQDKIGLQDRAAAMKLIQQQQILQQQQQQSAFSLATDYNRMSMSSNVMSMSSGVMSMSSNAMSMSRRGSCSLEVMEGLRAKCSARSQSQSSQQRNMSDSSNYTQNVSTSSETSELPPDILQSLSELTEEHIDGMPSMAEDSMSGRQSVSGVNGSLEELLAGLSDDIVESHGLFAQLNDHNQPIMEPAQLKRECNVTDGTPEMCQMQDQLMSAGMSLHQMGHCDTMAGGRGWSQHQSVDSQMQMNHSNTRSNHQQQFHQQVQPPPPPHMMQQRFDQQTPPVAQQFPMGGMSHVQSIMDNVGSSAMIPNQTVSNKLNTGSAAAAAQYRAKSASNPQQQMHMGMMSSQHHQPMTHDSNGRLMHSQTNSMMSGMTMNNPHRSSSHRLLANQSQQSAMTGQMMANDSDSRMSGTYMRSLSQLNQSSGGGMVQRAETMQDLGMQGHRGLVHNIAGQTHKMSAQMPLMHGNEMNMMTKNPSSRMMGGHAGMVHNSVGSVQQHQPGMMRHQSAMVQSPTTAQQNQFKQMMNQPGMLTSQSGPSVNQSRSVPQGQQMMSHNQIGGPIHHQASMMSQSRSGHAIQNHSEMMMNDSAMMKNSSLTQRGQSDMLMNDPAMMKNSSQRGQSDMMMNDSAMMKNSSLTQRGQSDMMMNDPAMMKNSSLTQRGQSDIMMNDPAMMKNSSQRGQSDMMMIDSAMMKNSSQRGQSDMMMIDSAMMKNSSLTQRGQSDMMMNDPAMMKNSSLTQRGQSDMMMNDPAMMRNSSQRGQSDMMMNDSAMMKNSSLTQRGQSDIMMMNQSRMNNIQTGSPAMKNYQGMMQPSNLDMMQMNPMGSSQHHLPKHNSQARDVPNVQQMVQDTPDNQIDMFNWLALDQGLSPDLLAADVQNGQAPIRVSPPKLSSGNYQSFTGDHFNSVGQTNTSSVESSMPVGNSSSLDFLTNPTSFLSRVHEDGYSSRQQMLQIAMAPDSNDGKCNRQTGNNMYHRQSSINAASGSQLVHANNSNISAASSGGSLSNGGRFQSGMPRDNMGNIGGRGMMSMHGGSARDSSDVPLDPNLSHLGRRTQQSQQSQQSQQMCNSTGSNVLVNYLSTTDSMDCANDSLMNQFFGLSASPLGMMGEQTDAINSAVASRPYQSMEATNSQDSVGGIVLNSALVTGSDERRSLESRHGSNGSLLQQLLSD